MPKPPALPLKSRFQIGSFAFEHPFVLAPMAGVTDRAFRDICRQKGAAFAVGEMVASQKQLWHSTKSSTRQADRSEAEPRIVQLLGTEPEVLAEAAAWQFERGAQIIDLNLGCPAKKVCSVAAGSALMGDPKKVAAIFKAVVSAVPVPVTVKMRTGTDRDNKNALQIAQLAQDYGLQAVTIHGRTRADKFTGTAEYDTIAQVKQALQIPVMANGDITTPQQADFVLKYTACDGVMIGRGSLGFPWIFQQCQQSLQGAEIQFPDLTEFAQTLLQHLQALHQLYTTVGSEITGVRHARKHFGWYAEKLWALHTAGKLTLPSSLIQLGLQRFRQSFNRLETSQQQIETIRQHLCPQTTLHYSANR